MFIRAKRNGEFINSDHIVRVRAGIPRELGYGPNPKHKMEVILADLRDGTVAELAGINSDDVATKMLPIIPANPGYEALWIVKYDDAIDVIRHPVLGWRMDLYGCLTPVTLDDMEYTSNVSYSGVKYPDGEVVSPCEARYANEKLWLEEMQEQARKVA